MPCADSLAKHKPVDLGGDTWNKHIKTDPVEISRHLHFLDVNIALTNAEVLYETYRKPQISTATYPSTLHITSRSQKELCVPKLSDF